MSIAEHHRDVGVSEELAHCVEVYAGLDQATREMVTPLALPHKKCYQLGSLPHLKCYRPMAPHQIQFGQRLLSSEASDAPRAPRPTRRPESDREEEISNTVNEAIGNKIT